MKRIRVVATILAGFSIPASAATLVVTSLADAGPGSLRDTVAASLPGDVITFSVTGPIVLTSGAIAIGTAISIVGPGPASLTISGSGADRVFVTSANPVLIANLTIRDGRVFGPNGPDGGIGQNGGPGVPAQGGGIYNSGTLTVSNCWITGCVAIGGNGGRGGGNPAGAVAVPGTGGAGGEAVGGGVYNANATPGTLSLVGCTLSQNQAIGGNGGAGGNNFNPAVAESGGTGGAGADSYGGGIFSNGAALTNCTFSGNLAVSGAGGPGGNTFAVFIGGAGGNGGIGHCGGISSAFYLEVLSCTIVLNQGVGGPAGPGGSGTPNGPSGSVGSGYGGGVCGYTIIPCGGGSSIGNTIVAKNNATLHPNQAIYWEYDLGYNFLGDNDVCGPCMGPTTTMGTLLSPLDPVLAPLAQNGGGMPTHAPLLGSPVIDQGNSFGLATDQRGAPRTYDYPSVPNQADGTDIGAVELGSTAPGLAVIGGNNIVISWPAYYQDLQLQSTPALSSGNRWVNVSDTPSLNQERLYVTNRMSAPSQFYRLINR